MRRSTYFPGLPGMLRDATGENMKKLQYGPCGLYCSACGAEDCAGCRSNVIDDHVRQCKFRRCTKDKDIEFCCFCSEYPCAELYELMNDKWPHHWTREPNLEFIRKHGRQEWLKAQEKEWSCINCGAAINWYQRKCKCGQELDAWDLPA